MVSCLAANAGVLPASKSPARVQPHGQSVPPTEGFARSDRGARSGMERGNAVKGNVEYRSRAAARICRESPLTEWSATRPRGKRPPVSLCHTASAGVGAEGAAPPTRDWFLGLPPGPFFPKKGEEGWNSVPPPVGATPRAGEGCDPTRSTPKRAEGSPQEHTSLRSKG